MTTIKRLGTFVVDTAIVFMLAFIALFVYAMYTSDTELMTALACHVSFDSEFDRNVCMIVND